MEGNLSKEALANISLWLEDEKYAAYKEQLQALIDAKDWKTLEDGFYKHIEFGTAGMRGTTGVGPAKINTVTIGEAAQAVADCLLSQNEKPSVVVAYDTRLTSPELSKMVAAVLAASGVMVYYFESFRSTPELSFAIRRLGASAGIVISASHNPPADNGFKVYWSDGAQVSSPDDKKLLEAFANIKTINQGDFNSLKLKDQIVLIGDEVDKDYLDTTLKVNEEYTDFNKDLAPALKIAYSPLHGAGQTSALPMLKMTGFDVVTVDAEMLPDGHFPALENNIANPEIDSANKGTIELMESANCDLGVVTDPDADRLRLTIRTNDGLKAVNGNQSSALATDYLLSKDAKGYICKTIVTTDLIDALAEGHKTEIYNNFLIGFKYIGRKVNDLEGTGKRFIIGAEESYGMLVGPQARDKDAATGALVLAEYAAELKKKGKNLYDRLFELYEKYGVFVEEQVSAMYPGADGFKTMQNVMAKLRSEPLTEVGGLSVTKAIDCLSEDTPTADKGDVIILEFNDDHRCRITIRPSGTEPKLKFYGQWYVPADKKQDIYAQYADVSDKTKGVLEALKALLLQ
ncbi:MAG: phospho-sugar mutase [Candidatus Saccharimonadales bacterium]